MDRIPLMLIHGAWLSARSWERFEEYFGNRGFAVSAPEWPRKHGDVEQLRDESEELAGLGLGEIVDHYEALIRTLAEPPVIGALVRRTDHRAPARPRARTRRRRAEPGAAEGDPRAAVLVAQGRLPGARASLEAPRDRDAHARGVPYGFVNTFGDEEAAAAYERYAVPETGRIFYQAGFANFSLHPPTDVHFYNDDRAPLLIVGAEQDHTVPASVSRAQAREVRALVRPDRLPRVRGAAAPVRGRRGLGGGRRGDRQLARRRARDATAAAMDLGLCGQGRRRHRREQGHRARGRRGRSRPRARGGGGRAVGRRARRPRRRHGGRGRPRRPGRPGAARRPRARGARSGRRARQQRRRRPAPHRRLPELGDADFEASLQLNFFSALRATRAAVAAMLARARGRSSTSPRSTRSSTPTGSSSTTAPPRRRC